ncbi:glycine-rich cell wall structural protein 1-like [Durio zibethinus]|uniref:Glycine-rich cell wall structural protein 1-like n=1 Tax=Durio zibethinus TaxID=66656 RepID=A0A6P6A7P7_DURZI|nr:glycine-rich cell wall structural protein 1-like [Durio zibethinus]
MGVFAHSFVVAFMCVLFADGIAIADDHNVNKVDNHVFYSSFLPNAKIEGKRLRRSLTTGSGLPAMHALHRGLGIAAGLGSHVGGGQGGLGGGEGLTSGVQGRLKSGGNLCGSGSISATFQNSGGANVGGVEKRGVRGQLGGSANNGITSATGAGSGKRVGGLDGGGVGSATISANGGGGNIGATSRNGIKASFRGEVGKGRGAIDENSVKSGNTSIGGGVGDGGGVGERGIGRGGNDATIGTNGDEVGAIGKDGGKGFDRGV